MTDQQPEALRLAGVLETNIWAGVCTAEERNQAAAELRRLHQHELAHNEWSEKTEWVQQTAQPHELGMHRADVMRQRIDRLHSVNAQLLEALEYPYWREEWLAKRDAAIAAAKEKA